MISVYDGAYSVYHEPMQPSYKKAKFMRLETVAAQVKPSNGKKNISDMKKQASNFGTSSISKIRTLSSLATVCLSSPAVKLLLFVQPLSTFKGVGLQPAHMMQSFFLMSYKKLWGGLGSAALGLYQPQGV